MDKHCKKIGSIRNELLQKSKEAMLAAVQIFNNPNIQFKTENFIVLTIIAWTYLMHAYYRSEGITYKYYTKQGKKRKFDKTKYGAYKHWELERCLNCNLSPLDKATTSNLRFLIGLRHEIEHQMTNKIDDLLSAKFQACCLNYNKYLKKLFGNKVGIEKLLSISLQFASISTEQEKVLSNSDLPKNILAYIRNFEDNISDELYNNPAFSYRVIYTRKLTNRKGQADRIIEFIPADSELANTINKDYVVIKELEKPKYLPSKICQIIQGHGYKKFTIHQHTKLWKQKDGKNHNKKFGVQIAKTWYWYDSWLTEVTNHCNNNRENYI